MIDNEKIPEPLLSDLIELLGYDEAEKFLDKVQYSFPSVQNKIVGERLKKKYGKRILIYILIIFILLFLASEFH
ncbi:hypothetical protein ACE1ET_06210 [Saccharicrinis sp. FJH62]|uniref:hypothetical protein n=1 Tax=Saccharicrinis sp. FJH62 TaxID=3344657 RepID=UPI0035D4DB89